MNSWQMDPRYQLHLDHNLNNKKLKYLYSREILINMVLTKSSLDRLNTNVFHFIEGVADTVLTSLLILYLQLLAEVL